MFFFHIMIVFLIAQANTIIVLVNLLYVKLLGTGILYERGLGLSNTGLMRCGCGDDATSYVFQVFRRFSFY